MRRRLIACVPLLVAGLLAAPLASAQPGISDGGADVMGDGGSGATVTVQGGYTEVPHVSGGVASSAPVTSSGGGGSPAIEPPGGGGGPVNRDPTIAYPRGGAIPEGADSTDTPVCDGVEVGVGSCVVRVAPTLPSTSPDLGVPATPQPVVDVTNLVSRAITMMQLEAPPMCFVPHTSETGAVGLTGLHSWAWICTEQVREATIGPVTRVATSGPVTVTATAVNTSVLINWGDGSLPTICPGVLLPFTPYVDAFDAVPIPIVGDAPSPTCGHFIGKSSTTEPRGIFNVSATSAWLVTWTATTPTATMGGAIPTPLTSTYTHRIGELQVLGTPGLPGMTPGGIPTIPALPG